MLTLDVMEDLSHWDGLRMIFDFMRQQFVPFQSSLHSLSDIVGIQVSDIAAFAQGPSLSLDSIQHSYYLLNEFGECKRDLSGNPIVDTTVYPRPVYVQHIATRGELARLLEISLDTATELAIDGILAADLTFSTVTPGVTVPNDWKIVHSGTWIGLSAQTYTFWSILL